MSFQECSAHYCAALIWRGQDWVQKCIYLPAQIGPLSVWSLLSLLLKDSEQSRASFTVCEWENWDVSQLAQTSALTITSLQQMQTKEEYISLVILIPLNLGGVSPYMRAIHSSQRAPCTCKSCKISVTESPCSVSPVAPFPFFSITSVGMCTFAMHCLGMFLFTPLLYLWH